MPAEEAVKKYGWGKIDLLYQQKLRIFKVPTSAGLLRVWSSPVYFAAIVTSANCELDKCIIARKVIYIATKQLCRFEVPLCYRPQNIQPNIVDNRSACTEHAKAADL